MNVDMNSKYEVIVNGKKFDIDLKKDGQSEILTDSKSVDMCYESIKSEYEHCMDRVARFDNKIYILITICTFIFSFAMTTITQQIKNFDLPKFDIGEILFIFYMIVLVIIIILFIILLCKLIYLLEGIKIRRLDANDLYKLNYFEEDSVSTARGIGELYWLAMSENNEKLEWRFLKFNKYSKLLIPIIILSIVEIFLGNFL
jgi:hypothetical protein